LRLFSVLRVYDNIVTCYHKTHIRTVGLKTALFLHNSTSADGKSSGGNSGFWRPGQKQ